MDVVFRCPQDERLYLAVSYFNTQATRLITRYFAQATRLKNEGNRCGLLRQRV